MYIAIDDEEIAQRRFAVCDFYDVETCFCWNADKLVIFPYTKDHSTGTWDARVLLTPAPVRKIQFFDRRAFLICAPQGIYKVSRVDELALLSKNALGMGCEFFQVLIAKSNGVYLDDKQIKSSTLLFPLVPNASETVCTFPLNPANIEPQLLSCFAAGWKTRGNLCVVAYHRKLYALRGDTVQLVYTSDSAIVDILPAKRQDKVAGLLLLTEHANVVILVHGNDTLVFERIHLGENTRHSTTFCAGFSLHMENVLWLVCCDRSRTYYIKKELFVDTIREVRVEERTFTCMQYYKPNVILALSQKKELIELSLEEMEDSLSMNNNVALHTEMFQKTDVIMEKICAKVKELNVLYENLMDEQDKLQRINLYAAKRKLQISPHIEVSRLCKYRYLALDISLDKLYKNSYVVFTFASKNQSTFCMKKVTETAVAIKMLINENRILHSSSINTDLITLMNEQRPWCLIPNFINSPPQDLKRKRGPKKDKTVFIDTKIASLRDLIAKKELSMTKLCEMKKIIRAEL